MGALFVGALAAILQPLQGDRLAKQTAVLQPAKLAAMEALFHTSKGAPLTIGGIPSEETQIVRYGIEIPGLLSFLALMLGIVAGASLLGATSPLEAGFYAAFVRPWANLFSFSVGVFTCVLFAFLAAVYLIGEPAIRRYGRQPDNSTRGDEVDPE